MSRKTRKRATCPTCSPDEKFAIYTRGRDFDGDGKWTSFWACNNCGHRKPITHRRRTWEPDTINARQQRTVDRLRTSLLTRNDGSYEWKHFDVTTTDYGTVWLSCESGMLNDEGTAASILCRDSWHVQIKSGGGTKVHSRPKWSKARRV